MKRSIIFLAATATLCIFSSCRKVTGEGPVQSELRAIDNFSGISTGVAGKVNYTIEPQFKVEIIAQRNILDVLETSTAGGHLVIKVKDGVNISSREEIIINISAPTADYLELSGSGILKLTGNLNASDLGVKLSGSGSIFINSLVVSNKMEAAISGSGNINVIAGTVQEEALRISGSGKMIMDGVTGKNAVVAISGSGNMQLNVSQLLDATLSGSGSVYYRGTPRVSAHISGSGRLVPLQ